MSSFPPAIPDYARANLEYANPSSGTCPLCRERPTSAKSIYGHFVCKKCLYRFVNRRQFAYVIDSILFTLPLILLGAWMERKAAGSAPSEGIYILATYAFTALVQCIFLMRDGFGGASPGKRLMGVLVLDEITGLPIGFGKSFKRNALFLLGIIPFAGGFATLTVAIVIIVQMNKGYRLGDRYAQTRVIWKKFADSPVFGGNGNLCPKCGYDLTGNVSGLCPECGTPVAPNANIVPVALPA